MKNSQRLFLIASFILLAIGLALYCVDYRVVAEDSPEGRLQTMLSNSSEPDLLRATMESSPDYRGLIPLINFGESNAAKTTPKSSTGSLPTADEEFLGPPPDAASLPTFSGIYSRPGLTTLEAVTGGMLIPLLFLIAAGYLALGTQFRGSKNEVSPTIAIQSSAAFTDGANDGVPKSQTSHLPPLPPPVPWQGIDGLVRFAIAVFPILLIIDLPTMMMMARWKYPRWVFAIHCLYAIGRR